MATPPMPLDDLQMLVRMLEMGMWDNARIQALHDTLDATPDSLLPHAIGIVGQAAFLMTRVGREPFALRTLLACLGWAIRSDQEDSQGPTLIENIRSVLKREGMDLSTEEIRRRALEREYGNTESWVFRTASPESSAAPAKDLAALGQGIRAGVASKLPLTTFRGWLKRLDSRTLNAGGRALMSEVFPRFSGEFARPEEHLEKTENLIRKGVRLPQGVVDDMARMRRLMEAGVPVTIRQHRRYAGGDGRLPRSCYSAVCSDAHGDDGGTLNRELMAYVHPCVPGTVFVGDSTDARINALLGNSIGVRPGYCAVYVFLFAPRDAADRAVFNAVYADTLKHSADPEGMVNVHALETRVDWVEIEGVLDLRLPKAQAWLFEHFRHGDGVHLHKPNGGDLAGFQALLPTLLHPELGGCPATHGIGSWLRTSPVNALIFPSARSDAMVTLHEGQLAGFRGWNLVDYRSAAEIASAEVVEDQTPWATFEELSRAFNVPVPVLDQAPSGSPAAGSWSVRGIQGRYDDLHRQMTR